MASTKLKVAALASVVAMVGTAIGVGTMAKYTTSFDVSDSARVAEFKFNGTDDFEAKTVNVFNTAYNSNKIKSKNTDKVVAPGATGSVTVGIEGTAEVDADIDMTFTETNVGSIPIYYTVGGANYSAVLAAGTYKDGNNNDVVIAGDLTAMKTAVHTDYTANTAYDDDITIGWTWLYENKGTDGTALATNDATDTALGSATTPATVSLTITGGVTQKA